MEKNITLLGQDRTAQGPFTVQEVTHKIESGEIRPDCLAHMPGLAQWAPVNQVLAQASTAGAVPQPGQYQPNSYAIDMAIPGHRYANFGLRFAAYMVDRIAISVLAIIAMIVFSIPTAIYATINPALFQQLKDGDNSDSSNVVFLIVLLYGGIFLAVIGIFIVDWLYHAWMESGTNEGTWGKQLVGIRVTDLQGRQISFMRATGRHFSRIFLSNSTCLIGYIIALFTDKKQSLHDLVASTVVVER